ncbi:MAG TPA: phosphoribosylamine--glycine ligase [Gammaproteobacteria bacterium]|nr:phosphoribosylamine--glycine ligase [Gammaproteobacteria bacterium]
MRFLGIGEYCSLGDMYYRLAGAGHEVRVYIETPEARDIYGGMLQQTPHWYLELDWVRAAGKDGVIIFESALKGAIQDRLRRDGFQVIGGSAFGDRLENERAFGQEILRALGLPTARVFRHTDFAAAIDFVRAAPARYVFKLNGSDNPRSRNYVGEMDHGEDMIALLSLQQAQWPAHAGRPDFVLMEYISGIEVGVGAYFNGRYFLRPACLDWEHKRFFPGELGELTDEMGTVVTYRGAERIFEMTLGRTEELLAKHGYRGYINLNLIANERGLWPLEFTSRFGYPGFAICETLHTAGWDEFLCRMLRHDRGELPTAAGFATGVVLTLPPYPHGYGYEVLSKGVPVSFKGELTPAERARLHFSEVALNGDRLVSSGMMGYIGVAAGAGAAVEQAGAQALALARKVVVPNLRYRNDIGARVIERDLAGLKELGFIE